MADPEDWWTQYRKKEAKRLEQAERMAQYLMGALQFLGVKRVTMSFDGSGDDGEMGDPVYEPIPQAGLPEGVDSLVGVSCAGQLPGGWEINAGSSGVVLIDVAAGTCEVNIEWRDDEDEEDDEFLDEEEDEFLDEEEDER